MSNTFVTVVVNLC